MPSKFLALKKKLMRSLSLHSQFMVITTDGALIHLSLLRKKLMILQFQLKTEQTNLLLLRDEKVTNDDESHVDKSFSDKKHLSLLVQLNCKENERQKETTRIGSPLITYADKVNIDKSRGEGSLLEQDAIENVSQPITKKKKNQNQNQNFLGKRIFFLTSFYAAF